HHTLLTFSMLPAHSRTTTVSYTLSLHDALPIFMLDSTDHRVLEEALERCQGKAIVNSINLEDGEERFEKVVPLLHRYGAAVVVGDRKSTRLNSSHVAISYAVFCLKQKNQKSTRR